MENLNDKAANEAVAAKLKELEARAAQQPVSYIQLYREAVELAEEQFRRAMIAEAALSRAEPPPVRSCIKCNGTGRHGGAFTRLPSPLCVWCNGTGRES
jgi:hypothetical protein